MKIIFFFSHSSIFIKVLIAAIKSVFFENTSEMSFLWFLFYGKLTLFLKCKFTVYKYSIFELFLVHSAGGLMSLCDVVGGAQVHMNMISLFCFVFPYFFHVF